MGDNIEADLLREANDILMARNERLCNEFARLWPGLKGDKFHRLFDRWLERLTLEDVK